MYFHPFVQQFLYGVDDKKPPLRRLIRNDVKGVRIEFGKTAIELDMARVELLLDMQVGMAVVEVASIAQLTLDEVLLIRDQFRRVYPPFWNRDAAGLCPDKVQWLDKCGKPVIDANASDFDKKSDYMEFVREHQTPRVSAHWDWLIRPLVADIEPRQEDSVRYRHIGDERIPELGYLEMTDPSLSRANWVRLAFLDPPGSGMPYSSGFLQDFDAKYCYDRYWSPTEPDGPMLTRYLNCGYGFTVVADGTFKILRDHFRNHYSKMGVITHFQKAWLGPTVLDRNAPPAHTQTHARRRSCCRTGEAASGQ